MTDESVESQFDRLIGEAYALREDKRLPDQSLSRYIFLASLSSEYLTDEEIAERTALRKKLAERIAKPKRKKSND